MSDDQDGCKWVSVTVFCAFVAVLGFCHGKNYFFPGQWKKTGKNRGKNWQNQRRHKLMTVFITHILQHLITTLAQTVNISKYENKCIK